MLARAPKSSLYDTPLPQTLICRQGCFLSTPTPRGLALVTKTRHSLCPLLSHLSKRPSFSSQRKWRYAPRWYLALLAFLACFDAEYLILLVARAGAREVGCRRPLPDPTTLSDWGPKTERTLLAVLNNLLGTGHFLQAQGFAPIFKDRRYDQLFAPSIQLPGGPKRDLASADCRATVPYFERLSIHLYALELFAVFTTTHRGGQKWKEQIPPGRMLHVPAKNLPYLPHSQRYTNAAPDN